MSGFSEHRYSSDDGLALYYRHYGANKRSLPIICLPGISRNCRDFESLAEYLSARYPVITPDFRGRGLSERDPNWRNYHPRTYVDDMLSLFRTMGVERAAFIGTSLGGIVSMALAAERPTLAAGVVLNDIGPEIGSAGLERIKGYLGLAQPVTDWAGAVAQARNTYAEAWPGLTDEDWEQLVRCSYRENSDGVPMLDMDPMIGEAARSVGTGLDDPWQLFDGLRDIPTLVLQGALSDILTDSIVARMKQRKADLQHVVVPDRGHVPLLNEAASLEAIDHFLENLA
ncbi:MAG: alpha/beta hydrolase [Woeseia sp.]